MMRPRLRIPLSRPCLGVPAQAARPSFAQQSRSLHAVPTLNHIKKEEGIPGLMDPDTFKMTWEDYQTHIIHNLNRSTADTDFESADLKSIIIKTAREPVFASIFNHASMAHNNEFFFRCMSPKETIMPERLELALTKSFGSIKTLREQVVHTAAAMFSPGFIWLCRIETPGNPNVFKILTTYSAGSPYPEAHWRRQEIETNTAIGQGSADGLKAGKTYLDNSAFGAGKPTAEAQKRLSLAPGGVGLEPILCLNTWEHVWLRQFGFQVGNKTGKQVFAENWWFRINWEVV
ncbi:putative 37S ribosomal protein, partial [Podospora australis]